MWLKRRWENGSGHKSRLRWHCPFPPLSDYGEFAYSQDVDKELSSVCEYKLQLFSFVFAVDIFVGDVWAKYEVWQLVVDGLLSEKRRAYSW